MAEHYGFFDAVGSDRQYSAEDFCEEYFGTFLVNGVAPNSLNTLEVTSAGVDMNTDIDTGKCFINGYYYYNDASTDQTHSTSDPTNDRIDRVILRLDTSTGVRTIAKAILTGTPAPSPTAPALTRSGDVYEMSLAQVLVENGVSVIGSGKITDERNDDSVCGYARHDLDSNCGTKEVNEDAIADGKIMEYDTAGSELIYVAKPKELPVGTLIAYGDNSEPTDYLECDGAEINRTTYATLFAVIGETYGVGNGTTTFDLPDSRAEFLRGWDNGRGIDSGRTFGTSQDGTQFHGSKASSVPYCPWDFDDIEEEYNDLTTGRAISSSGTAAESYPRYKVKPRNLSVMYCIKYQ